MQAYAVSKSNPDENYAREVMQLFTGLEVSYEEQDFRRTTLLYLVAHTS